MEDIIKVVKESALIGGLVLKENFGKINEKDIEEKNVKDFVSYVDKEAERRITEYIEKHFPDHTIIGEEGTNHETESEFVWYIDPLDGTKNYICGFPIFGVSVGVLKEGKPYAGAVYLPFFDDLYWACENMGAFKNNKRINVSNRREKKYCYIVYGFPSRARRNLDNYWNVFKSLFTDVAAMRRPGAAAVDLCFLAEGIFDGLAEFELNPWDLVAGIVILKEAGGSYFLSKGFGRGTDIIASNGFLQEYLEETVKKYISFDY